MLYFNLAQKTADPSLASVVLTGVVIVFFILLFFVFIFSLFGFFSKLGKKQNVKATPVPTPIEKPAKAVKAQPVAVADNDDEIIAVIAAAVYSIYEGSGKKPIIRSIKPARASGRSPWSTAGLMNNIKSF